MGQVTRKASKASRPPFALEGIDHILLLVSGMAHMAEVAARACRSTSATRQGM